MDFKKVFAGAVFSLLQQRLVLAKALLLPMVAYLVLGFVSYLEAGIMLQVFVWLLSTVVEVLIAVTTHRIVLLGAGSVPAWGIFVPTAREWWFLLYLLGLTVLMGLVGMLVTIPVIGVVLWLLAALYLLSRLSLVFPAIAVDQPISFAASWQRTQQHQKLMLLVVIIVPVLVGTLSYLVGLVPYAYILGLLLWPVGLVFTVAMLSMAYLLIVQSEGIEDNSQTQ
ncbi:hypothetical protein [Gilvimarinus agarilyticus]|uniref:hypothetical protein n=1 Tax=Gilvimarinus agarilyticus TaxID=679259 RepID=UPI00059F6331|nr:hypothetical protein [Gilvimarinus agarilyticus]